jgi:hypothetical protein
VRYAELDPDLAGELEYVDERCLEWSGGDFDPARFDQEAVNRTLEKIGER